MKKCLFPVLLGADLNCYSMARSFHEAYGVISDVFGKEELGPVRCSRIVRFHKWPFPFSQEPALSLLLKFAAEKKEKPLVLIGCTDEYAEFIIENKETLSAAFFCPYPDFKTADRILSKDSFYETAKIYGLPVPETFVISSPDDVRIKKAEAFGYPLVIKPASSAAYWKNPFAGMKKVWFSESADETASVVSLIYSSGYAGNLILQSYVEGDDSDNYVVTCYSDKRGRMRMAAPARVLLEEHSPKALGNHAAALTCRIPKIADSVKTFLNGIGYCGFSNFDIKRDNKTGQYYFLEVNLRQGRSNYYLTGCKINPADLIRHDINDDWEKEILFPSAGYYWHTVPSSLIYQYVKDKALLRQTDGAVKKGKESDSLSYPYDLRLNLRRKIFVFFHNLRYRRKYRRYYKRDCRK